MTVSNTDNKVTENGNGSKTEFDFSFPIFDESELKVYLIDSDGDATLQTITTHYTVSINSVTEGGTVTWVTAPASGEQSFIKRVLPFGQSTDIPTEGNFPESQVENALDKAYMLLIQMQEELDRSLKFGLTSTTSGVNFPEPEADKVLAWNSAGTNLENQTLTEIDSASIADGAITTEKLAGTAVTSAKLAASAVTEAKINDGAVATAKLAATSVTTAKIAAGAVTLAKMANLADMKVIGNVSGGAATPAEVGVLDEDDMASDSATGLVTQQSVKAFVEGKITGLEVFEASGTFTAPAGITQVVVTLVGAGAGGGGGENDGGNSGGGGGGGETVLMQPYTVTPGNGYTVTVGSGGGGGATSPGGGAGGAGGASSFDGSLTAAGGGAGQRADDSGTGGAGGGSALDGSGLSGGGSTGFKGGDGADTPSSGDGGGGGGSLFGTGGDGGNPGAGSNATGYGAGGGGGGGQNPAGGAGGDGSDGLVIVMW